MSTRTVKDLLIPVTVAAAERHMDAGMIIPTATPDVMGNRVVSAGLDIRAFRTDAPLGWWQRAALFLGAITHLEIQTDYVRVGWMWNPNYEGVGRIQAAWESRCIGAARLALRLTGDLRPNAFGGFDYLATELIEINLCAVPVSAQTIAHLHARGLWPHLSTARERGTPDDVTEIVAKASALIALREQSGGEPYEPADLLALQDARDVLDLLLDHEREPVNIDADATNADWLKRTADGLADLDELSETGGPTHEQLEGHGGAD